MQNLMQLESSRTLVLIARVRVMVAWRGDFTANLKHQNWPIRHLELRGSASFTAKDTQHLRILAQVLESKTPNWDGSYFTNPGNV